MADEIDRRTGQADYEGGPKRATDPPAVGSKLHTALGQQAEQAAHRAAEEVQSRMDMGLVGTARKLANVSAVALIGAMACGLMTVLVAVMWFALQDASRQRDATIDTLLKHQDSIQKREEQFLLANQQLQLTFSKEVTEVRTDSRRIADRLDRLIDILSQTNQQLKRAIEEKGKDHGPPCGCGQAREVAPRPRRSA